LIRYLTWDECLNLEPGDKILVPRNGTYINEEKLQLPDKFEEATFVRKEIYLSGTGPLLWLRRRNTGETNVGKARVTAGWIAKDFLKKVPKNSRLKDKMNFVGELND
jgi:hypothetical protein